MANHSFLVNFNNELVSRFNESLDLTLSTTNIFKGTKKLPLASEDNVELEKFINELNNILDILINIMNYPYIQTTTEEIITRSELVSILTEESFTKTMKDPALWKDKNGKMTPEQVYSVEYIDTINNYENRFIIYVFKKILTMLKTYKDLSLTPSNSLKTYYETNEASLSRLSIYENLFNENEAISKYVFNEGLTNVNFNALKEIHKKAKRLKLHKFYKKLEDTSFHLPINMTNTILHDRRYNKVYRFYKENLFGVKEELDFDKLFFNYAVIRLLHVISENDEFKLENLVDLSLNEKDLVTSRVLIKFKLDKFAYSLKINEDDKSLTLNIKLNNVSHRILIRFVYALEDKKEFNENEYDECIYVTNNNLTPNFNNVCELNYEKEIYSDLEILNIFKSTRILIPVYIDEINKCPFCGETHLLHSESSLYTCLDCNGSFNEVKIGKKKYIWIKKLWDETKKDK